MRIEKLRLVNYRKFKNVDLSFTRGMNLIVGSNASGKTTIVEAIGYAIYGELLRGTGLLGALRLGSESCRIELSLSNSDDMEVVREIQKVRNSVNQRIILNGREIETSDISRTKRVFMDKELFFETASVSQFGFHNLLDMSQERFRHIFSTQISPWDINRISDNSKSLQGYLRSRQNLYLDQIENSEVAISRFQSTMKSLDRMLTHDEDIRKMLEVIKKENDKLRKKLARKEVEIKEIRTFNETLAEALAHQQNLLRSVDRCNRFLSQKDLPTSMRPRITKNLEEYIAKIDSLRKEILELSNLLKNILEFQREYEHDAIVLRDGYSRNLRDLAQEEDEIELRLAQISGSREEYRKQKEQIERSSDLLNQHKTEMKKYGMLLAIEERLKKLALDVWAKNFGYFMSKVTNRMNNYLNDLGVNIRAVVKDERMRVLIDSNLMDSNALSGGERTLLNLLSRITLIKEMGTSDLLILDDAVTFLDQKTTSKVFSLLASLKEDFGQIIITTHRRHIPIDFDNKIDLDG